MSKEKTPNQITRDVFDSAEGNKFSGEEKRLLWASDRKGTSVFGCKFIQTVACNEVLKQLSKHFCEYLDPSFR